MNDMKLMFLILRKNTKLLKEYVENGSKRDRGLFRKNIILLKSMLAALPTKKYNLLKTIATEVTRFDIITLSRDFEQESEMVKLVIPGTDIVVKTFFYHTMIMSSMYGETVKDPDPKVLYDKHLNIYFILDKDETTVQDVTLFSGSDHVWFSSVFRAIKDAKDAEEEIIKQRELMEAQRKVELFKDGILNKYS